MDHKVLWMDVETTGTDPKKHGLIQVAMIAEINGEQKDTLDLRIQPYPDNEIDLRSLELQGITEADFEAYMIPDNGYEKLVNFFNRYIDKFDTDDKFFPAGYNVQFDLDFLEVLFKRNNNQYLFSYLHHLLIDPLPILNYLIARNKLSLPSRKLETVCKHFGIEIEAHNPMSDLTATKQLVEKIDAMLSIGGE